MPTSNCSPVPLSDLVCLFFLISSFWNIMSTDGVEKCLDKWWCCSYLNPQIWHQWFDFRFFTLKPITLENSSRKCVERKKLDIDCKHLNHCRLDFFVLWFSLLCINVKHTMKILILFRSGGEKICWK
jgi:hypothetical protein